MRDLNDIIVIVMISKTERALSLSVVNVDIQKNKKLAEKPSGEYEIDQSKQLTSAKSRHRQHRQRYNDDKLDINSDELQSTGNPESANYAEYNYDDNKMTVEDNDCKDYSDECNEYASRGYCSEYAPTASIGTINMMCKRACGTCSTNTMPKEKQDTYEVMDKEDSFYKKGKIGKSDKEKQKHLEHRLNKL